MTASVQCVGINQRYTMLYQLIKGVYCDFKEGKVMHMEVPTALPPNTNHLWGPKQIPPRDVPIGHNSDYQDTIRVTTPPNFGLSNYDPQLNHHIKTS